MARVAVRPDAGAPSAVDDPFWVLVRKLPRRQRAVVALRYVDDLALDEIAQVLEISVGTVKSTLSAARAALSASLTVEEVVE